MTSITTPPPEVYGYGGPCPVQLPTTTTNTSTAYAFPASDGTTPNKPTTSSICQYASAITNPGFEMGNGFGCPADWQITTRGPVAYDLEAGSMRASDEGGSLVFCQYSFEASAELTLTQEITVCAEAAYTFSAWIVRADQTNGCVASFDIGDSETMYTNLDDGSAEPEEISGIYKPRGKSRATVKITIQCDSAASAAGGVNSYMARKMCLDDITLMTGGFVPGA